MAGLLVSVRSAYEARAAVAGGATVIDVKEPTRGPLGRADERVWSEVRQAVPPELPISVALGELPEWLGAEVPHLSRSEHAGLAYRKLGLSGAAVDWIDRWASLRASLGPGPAWIGVIYADWTIAGAPAPTEVLDVVLSLPECAGILVDTWDKTRQSLIDESWSPWLRRVRESGRLVALAGGLDETRIAKLASLAPDYFAVRGAACFQGDREAAIDPARVARLVRAVRNRT